MDMNLRSDLPASNDDILFIEDPDVPIVAWTLDELDDSADLGTLRYAAAGTHDAHA